MRERISTAPNTIQPISSSMDSISKSTTAVDQGETKTIKSSIPAVKSEDPSVNSGSDNLCVLCLTEEKKLACIPCGHLSTCVPCGHSLRSCPICRRGIDAFVRIYL